LNKDFKFEREKITMRTKKELFICFILVGIINCSTLVAQDKPVGFTAANTIYLELGGNAGQYALMYGKTVFKKENLQLIGSAGFSLWVDPIEGSTIWNPALPLEFSALIGRTKHHLELGLGFTPFIESEVISSFEPEGIVQSKGESNLSAIIPFRIGYRYQKPEGGFFFRVGYTPFFKFQGRNESGLDFQPIHAGLGFGVSF
jgi:hypothetical protein